MSTKGSPERLHELAALGLATLVFANRPGRFVWIFRNVRKLAKPVPAKGRQGLWIPSADLVSQVEAALSASVAP